MPEYLIPKHGGFRKLKTFQLAQLIYDLTVRFCDRYIDRRSRTHDQMVQAARSAPQNVAEGSQASGTSKKTELKLTGVARATLEELKIDYQDFLRQRGRTPWPPEHPALVRFRARRCATLMDVQDWIKDELSRAHTDVYGPTPTHPGPCNPKSGSPMGAPRPCPPSAELAANGALSLINLCTYLLDHQLRSQAATFTREGGFTERLYRIRKSARNDDYG